VDVTAIDDEEGDVSADTEATAADDDELVVEAEIRAGTFARRRGVSLS